ncbi:MAG: hypothetical protein EBT86_02385 [Actinobacteria bacterium]|nr:hypothetical protein [Actinomycetota bacterium]
MILIFPPVLIEVLDQRIQTPFAKKLTVQSDECNVRQVLKILDCQIDTTKEHITINMDASPLLNSVPVILATSEFDSENGENWKNTYVETHDSSNTVSNDKSESYNYLKTETVNELTDKNEMTFQSYLTNVLFYFLKNIVPFGVFMTLGMTGCYAMVKSIDILATSGKGDVVIWWAVSSSIASLLFITFLAVDYYEDQEWYLANLTLNGYELDLRRQQALNMKIYRHAYENAWFDVIEQIELEKEKEMAGTEEMVEADADADADTDENTVHFGEQKSENFTKNKTDKMTFQAIQQEKSEIYSQSFGTLPNNPINKKNQ